MPEQRRHGRSRVVYTRIDPVYKSAQGEAWAPLSGVLPGLVLYRDREGILYATDEKRWLRDFGPVHDTAEGGGG